ncbi:hypothetical protein [Paenibacillus terrigena]|uniref:hypothetical protein n=1 Tax=Paenibacillus terrigena TaxID=369333 RepID=UPI00036C18A8|nr:hypothetical protein [Paenibacillus terrigena]
MNRSIGVMKMHLRDKLGYLYLPWIICLGSFSVNLLIGGLIQEEKGFYSGGVMSIFVYMLVAGIVVVPQTIPFALGLGVRRSDYFTGTASTLTLLSFVFSIVLSLLSWIEAATSGWGVKLGFFHLPYLYVGSYLQQFLVFFLIMLMLSFWGFIIACYHRRFGKAGTFTLFIVLFLLSSLFSFYMTYFGDWMAVFQWFADKTALDLAIRTIPFSIIFAALSYLFLRRSTV